MVMNELPHYGKVWAIGHRAVEGLFNGPVIVQEKVDGSQISFASLDGRLYVRSKGNMLVDGASPGPVVGLDNLTVDGMFQAGVEAIAARFEKIPDGLIFRGEYLNRPKHNTLAYQRVPAGNIAIFDVQDGNEWLDPEEIEALVGLLDFDQAPTLASLEQCSSHLELVELLETPSFLGGQKIEGIVVKAYDRMTPFGDPMFAKYVSEAFKEKHSGDWKARNPNGADFVANLIAQYRTEARWRKAVEHARDAGWLKREPADIGPLMKELSEDFTAECGDEVRDELWKHFGKKVVRGVGGGFAQWYKDQLMESAFDERPRNDEDRLAELDTAEP